MYIHIDIQIPILLLYCYVAYFYPKYIDLVRSY